MLKVFFFKVKFRTMFISQETIYKMNLIISLKLLRNSELDWNRIPQFGR